MSDCTIHYDGKALVGKADTPLIDFLAKHGIDLPHVCYHRALGSPQTCDVCWVQVDGELVRGCTLKARDGLQVTSEIAEAKAAREEGMDRLVAKHELYCTLCEHNTGDCTLHNTYAQINPPIQRYEFKRKPYEKDHSNPFYTYDPDQCILCGRCVEACQNVEVNETLSIDFTMEHPRVLWDGGKPIDQVELRQLRPLRHRMPVQRAAGKDHATGCRPVHSAAAGRQAPDDRHGQDARGDHRRAADHRPLEDGHALAPAGKSSAPRPCAPTAAWAARSRCGHATGTSSRCSRWLTPRPTAFLPASRASSPGTSSTTPKRLTTPLIRENGQFREASWDEALDLVAHRLLQIRDTHGPDAIGFIGSSKASNEEAYLTQKIARAIIGTHSVDNSSR